jgi:hypothetical protein
MVQGCEEMSFPLEAREPLLVSREKIREKLEGYLPAELRVASPVDFTHPTHAEKGRDLEGSESGPSRDRHWGSFEVKTTIAGQRSGILLRRRGMTACNC